MASAAAPCNPGQADGGRLCFGQPSFQGSVSLLGGQGGAHASATFAHGLWGAQPEHLVYFCTTPLIPLRLICFWCVFVCESVRGHISFEAHAHFARSPWGTVAVDDVEVKLFRYKRRSLATRARVAVLLSDFPCPKVPQIKTHFIGPDFDAQSTRSTDRCCYAVRALSKLYYRLILRQFWSSAVSARASASKPATSRRGPWPTTPSIECVAVPCRAACMRREACTGRNLVFAR